LLWILLQNDDAVHWWENPVLLWMLGILVTVLFGLWVAERYFKKGERSSDMRQQKAEEKLNLVISLSTERLQSIEEELGKTRTKLLHESFALGVTLYHQGKYEDAAAKFRDIVDKVEALPEVYYNWGVALYDLKRYDDAIQKYKKAVELKPDFTEAYLHQLGCCAW